MGYAIQHEITLSTLTCCNCGIVYAMPEQMIARLKREGGSFYCPNGHGQHFTEPETDRLRRLLDEANRSKTQLAGDYATLQREHMRLQRRITAGVCPCCNRTFQNLARHMAAKHSQKAA